MMASICVEAERAEEISLDAGFTNKTFGRIDQSIAMAALFTAYHLGCKAILALTESGSTALWMSRQKIHVPIFGLTSQIRSQRRMAMYRNVTPLLMPNFDDRDEALTHAEQLLVEAGVLKPGDTYAHHLRRADGLPGRHQHAEGRARRLMTGRSDRAARASGAESRRRAGGQQRPGRARRGTAAVGRRATSPPTIADVRAAAQRLGGEIGAHAVPGVAHARRRSAAATSS